MKEVLYINFGDWAKIEGVRWALLYLSTNCLCFRADFEEKISSLLLQLEATLKSLLEKSGNL